MREDLAIVQTVDFFTPIVDDPYDYGQIAAAYALIDCFTMGARPITGLNLVAFPCDLGLDVLGRVLSGGAVMNCMFNGLLDSFDTYEDSFVSPCPDDSGVSVGGALLPRLARATRPGA